MGLIHSSAITPPHGADTGNGTNHRLSAIGYRDVLDADRLLPGPAAMAVQRLGQRRERADQLIRLGKALQHHRERLIR